MAGLSLRLGLGLQAGGQAAAAVLQPAGAPTGIHISNSEVDDGAAAGTLVGTMLMVGGTEPAIFTLSSNPSSLWAIDGDRLEVAGDLSALGGTEESPVVKVTDALGQTFEAILPITIAETAAGNDSGIGEDDGDIVTPDPDDPASDGGGFEITPIQQDTSDGLKVSGKNGGSATFLKDLGAPVAGNTYVMKYTADWSGMTKQGRQAAVGFAFKNGNDFHLVGLRGDGAPATTMLASQIHGDFRKANQFTVTNDGAAAHGSKDGPNWLQLVIAGDGSTYTLSSSADGETWSAEYTDTLPTPLASAGAALQFGPGGYFTNQDKGVFSITIETFEGLAGVFEAAFIQRYSSAVSGTGVTFSAADLGAPDATREIVVAISCRSSVNTQNFVASMTIGGVAAVRDNGPVINGIVECGIWRAAVPDGETGDIVVTLNGAGNYNRWTAGVFRMANRAAADAAPHDTAVDAGTGTRSTTIDVEAGGTIIAAACLGSDIDTTWGGVTEDYELSAGTAHDGTGASDTFEAGEAGRTVSLTMASSQTTNLRACSYS